MFSTSLFPACPLFQLCVGCSRPSSLFHQVTFRLEKRHVHETVMNYGPQYYLFLIRDKIRHEMGNLCSNLTLQELYMEKFFEVLGECSCLEYI